jgi:hypothetical protein
MTVVPALGRLRQEDCQFKATQGFIARPYYKKSKQNKTRQQLNKP